MEFTHNEADGLRIAYRTAGPTEGEPVVFLHATALSQAMWRAFGYVQALQDRHRLVLVDLRGHGRTDKPHSAEAYSMDHLVADVLAVLDAENISRADLVGYSLGSRVALAVAVTAPQRVRRLALGGTSSRSQTGAFDALFFPGCADVLATEGMPEFLRRWEIRRGTPIDNATRVAFSVNDSDALAAFMRELDRDRGVPDSVLAQLRQPTLVWVGADDATRLDDSRHVVEVMPNAQLLVVPGHDHATTPAAATAVLAELAPFLED